MAAPIQPSNGFITRLLQQTTPAASNNSSSEQKSSQKSDQTTISQEARQASKASPNHQLESKLIALYNQKGEKKD